MARRNYVPSEDEIDAFDEDLTHYARVAAAQGDTFNAEDLRTLARIHWPGENVHVKADALGIDWVDSRPDLVAGKPARPAAGTPSPGVQDASQPASPMPPQRHPNAAVQAARDGFVDVYGGGEGVKIITAREGYDHTGRVVDGHLATRGRNDGLDEQARAEIAKLPAYGEPGWGEVKRRLTAIRQAAAQRAAAGQQATTPGRSEREAERAAVAGFAGVETGTWSQVRAAAGQQLLAEANRERARKWTPKL